LKKTRRLLSGNDSAVDLGKTMRVEQDLRIAIKAAANVSKNQDKSKTDRQLVEEWVKKNPAKAAKARALVKKIEQADAAEKNARLQLEKQFGLSQSHWRGCGEFTLTDEAMFQKAGGKIATKLAKFSEEQVITEYAAAKTKQEAEKVLAKYGIVWK
jgi:hypothetical protein